MRDRLETGGWGGLARLRGLALCVLLLIAPSAVAEEVGYRISTGDVLELTVVGVPQLQHRAVVAPDGNAFFPLIEDIAAAGRTLAAVRGELRAKLSTRVAPRQNGDGVTDVIAFAPEQIGLVIAEYRPVYVSGHVAQPGEQRYRVGMTVREALAVAGGLSVETPAPAASSDYAVLLNDLAFEQTRLARLEAERAGTAEIAPTPGVLSAAPGSDAARLAGEQLASRRAAREKERAYLTQAMAAAEQHKAILKERRAAERDGYEADRIDFERANDLFKRGIAVVGRVSEARRNMLLSATQLLQTDSSLAAAEREILLHQRQIARLDEERDLALGSDIEESRLKVQNLQTKLMFAGRELALLGAAAENTGSDAASVAVFRRGEGRTTRVAADLDTELKPGDVVEITLPGVPAGGARGARRSARTPDAAARRSE